MENGIEGDGNNTPTQRKLGQDIGIIEARWRNTPMMSNFCMCDSCRFTTMTQNLDLLCEIVRADKT